MQTLLQFVKALIELIRWRKHQIERRAVEHEMALELERLRREHRYQDNLDGIKLADRAAEVEAASLKAERAHQLTLAQVFMDGLSSMQEASRDESKANADALIALAQSQAKHAESFSDWLKLFQSAPAPSSSTVRPEDELWLEQQKLMDAGMPVELAELPEELKLAWALQNDPNFMDIGPMKP